MDFITNIVISVAIIFLAYYLTTDNPFNFSLREKIILWFIVFDGFLFDLFFIVPGFIYGR